MNFNYSYYFNFYEDLNKETILLNSSNCNYSSGFENVFDCLYNDGKILLDKVYEYSKSFNNGIINKKVWIHYIVSSKITIPPVTEQYIINDSPNDIENVIGKNGKNISIYLSNHDLKDNNINKLKSKPLFNTNNNNLLNITFKKFDIISKKTAFYNNEFEMIISLMNCLFSTKKGYYIKKCDLCDKYYISNKSDTHYCRRIKTYKNKELTCDGIVAAMQKTRKYKDSYEVLNRKFLNRINDMANKKEREKYKATYRKERDIIKLKYFKTNNINVLVDFINDYEKYHPF